MEQLIWFFKTHDIFGTLFPLIISFLITYILFQGDFVFLIMAWVGRIAISGADDFIPGLKSVPDGLVIIPSLLRNEEDLNAITVAVDSCAMNGYSSKLIIIASVDGNADHPDLYQKLVTWSNSRSYPKNVYLYVMGTTTRRSKIMAIDAATKYMEELVEKGIHDKFPIVYFSADGDGILNLNALERLAIKLQKRNRITGNPCRVVSGKINVRKDLVWSGWKNYFSIKGQICNQAAREFIICGISRYNWRIAPRLSLSGALYVTWSELLIQAPKYMGFLQSVKITDCIKWWFGFAPPLFSNSVSSPLPEALTGSTDDTSMAFLATISRWKNGHLSLDAPRTPLHALYGAMEELFIARSHGYEPEAAVYTYTPVTINGLWNQRIRWNAARFECSVRFAKAMLFHYDLFFIMLYQLSMIIKTVVGNILLVVVVPIYFYSRGNSIFVSLVFGYVIYTTIMFIYLLMALILERDIKHYWKVMLGLPFTIIYSVVFGSLTMTFGNIKDVLFMGNKIRFVPEETLIKGKSQRIAILYRIRRFVSMCIRSIQYGDVPFGRWWFGFREHLPYVESGYKNWTSGKRSHYNLR